MTHQVKKPALIAALTPLAAIADAYDANNLDDEARKFGGANNELRNETDPADIELYAGRGGRELLTLEHCMAARHAVKKGSDADLVSAVQPLFDIANAYDANELDDEARKVWGRYSEYTNETPPADIPLYTGRGGGTLLTLEHALAGRAARSDAFNTAA